MSPTYADLFRSVLIAPDDDLPRLVLADWLEENGEADRAKAIRDEVESRVPILDDLPGFQRPRVLAIRRRGFVEQVTVSPLVFFAAGAALFAEHPITAVFFSKFEPVENGRRQWLWLAAYSSELEGDPARFANLPAVLWHALDGDERPEPHLKTNAKFYPTKSAADLALSWAAVTVGRKAAGLPPYQLR